MDPDKRIADRASDTAPDDHVRATEDALIAAYRTLVACQNDKRRQLPDLLVHLVPTREWIDSVARSQAARDAFQEAAARFCSARLDRSPLTIESS